MTNSTDVAASLPAEAIEDATDVPKNSGSDHLGNVVESLTGFVSHQGVLQVGEKSELEPSIPRDKFESPHPRNKPAPDP